MSTIRNTNEPVRTPVTQAHTTTPVMPAEYAAFSRIRWGAVFAGTLVALVTMITLNLLGLGIGFASINPTTEANPFSGIGTGAIIWYVVASLISLFAGGFVAGKLSGFPKSSNAGMHGLLSWGLFTLISLYLFTTAMGRVISGVGSAISGVTSGVVNTAQAIVPNNLDNRIAKLIDQNVNTNLTFSDIRREAAQLLEDTDKAALDPDNLRQDARQLRETATAQGRDAARDPYAARNEMNTIIDRIQAKGSNIVEAADRDALVNVIVARTDMGEAEARRTVSAWESRLQQAANTISEEYDDVAASVEQRVDRAADRAAEIGGNVADGLATAAILGFVALLLGAGAAFFGGTAGRQRDLTLTNGQTVNASQVTGSDRV